MVINYYPNILKSLKKNKKRIVFFKSKLMEDVKKEIISMFEIYLESLREEYDISDEQKKVLKEKIREDVFEEFD